MLDQTDSNKLRTEVLGRIRESIIVNRNSLASATEATPLSMVAWLARNLLELAIWAEYCRSSEDRANEFKLDAVRDAYDAIQAPEALLSQIDHNIPELKQQLLDKADLDSVDIEKSFTAVSAAAKALNRQDLFRFGNKTLSKHAHPTAIAVFSLGDSDEQLLRSSFESMGNFLAQAGLMFTDLNVPPQDPYPVFKMQA